ncbi:hypothetical protein BRAS3843_1480016 [Bradyrhizobium sp. STM 3843]|uniref:hypothetical protein n=1 Tax=Bradyrhizobium sp. STM 3843 TaxID=551947 RepID=UPI0002406B9B|nr:hypothetical protein [Bradyrhizobium sp. STM 3843]CCE05785.1 hypothetical protein BRAS3843_1480016 [Bradyrhizobium sp. STM 3843]
MTELPDGQKERLSIFEQPAGVDWLLNYIVDLVEKGLSLPLTVTTEGSMITGTAIGGREYFESIGGLIARSSPEEFGADLGRMFSQFQEIYPRPEDLQAEEVRQRGFLHLRDARVLLDTRPIKDKGNPWRIQ